MKYCFFIPLLLITMCSKAQVSASTDAPTQDTLAPYQKTSEMPAFTIMTAASKWFSRIHLKDNKPTLILYFSPDCGHCKLETEDLISNIHRIKNMQIIMITSRSFEDMTAFADFYKLSRFKNIIIGRDPSMLITRFYDVKFTPLSALYDKDGKLVTIYRRGINFDELARIAGE